VLGFVVEASDEEDDVLGLLQLFQLNQEGADQPPAVERQPLAAPIVKHTVKAPKVVHRENATRMASDPSLFAAISCRGDSIPVLANCRIRASRALKLGSVLSTVGHCRPDF